MSKPTPRLDSGLIARKGEAAPAASVAAPAAQPVAPAAAKAAAAGAAARPAPPKGMNGTIAVTVRLDPERYRRLKAIGTDTRQTNQQIFVAALDAWLEAQGV